MASGTFDNHRAVTHSLISLVADLHALMSCQSMVESSVNKIVDKFIEHSNGMSRSSMF